VRLDRCRGKQKNIPDSVRLVGLDSANTIRITPRIVLSVNRFSRRNKRRLAFETVCRHRRRRTTQPYPRAELVRNHVNAAAEYNARASVTLSYYEKRKLYSITFKLPVLTGHYDYLRSAYSIQASSLFLRIETLLAYNGTVHRYGLISSSSVPPPLVGVEITSGRTQ